MKKMVLAGAMAIALSISAQATPLWMNLGSGNTYVADHISVSNVGMVVQDGHNPSYLSFVLRPDSGFQINFADFSFLVGTSGGVPGSSWFSSSLDGFGSKIGWVTAGTPVSLTGTLFQGITGPIEFRLYGYDTLNGLGAATVDQFAFHGSVAPTQVTVPESAPGLIAFGAALGLLAAARQRTRV